MATVNVYYADTMLVAPYNVWGLLARIDTVAEWAPAIVGCCIVENGAHPTSEGCVRRSLLRTPIAAENAVIREVLESSETGSHQNKLTLRYLAGDVSVAQLPTLYHVLVEEWVTTWQVLSIPADPNKCFVSVTAVARLNLPDDVVHREQNTEARNVTTQFLQRWVTDLHIALSNYVISVAYPLVESRLHLEHRKQYDRFEDAVVQMAARSDIPAGVSTTLEVLLQTWIREAKNSLEKDTLIQHLRLEVAAARQVAEAASIAAASSPQPQAVAAATPVVETIAEPAAPTPTAAAPSLLNVVADVEVPTPSDQPSPYRPPAPRLEPVVLSKLVVNGHVHEERARRAFEQLDPRRSGWLRSEDVATLLSTAEHFGLFEDKDGTIRRADITRMSSKQQIPTLAEEREQDLTPRRRQRLRDESTARQQEHLYAMLQFVERWVHKHTRRRDASSINFDEFCLILLQLSK